MGDDDIQGLTPLEEAVQLVAAIVFFPAMAMFILSANGLTLADALRALGLI